MGDGLVPVSGGEELFKDVKVLAKCCWIKTMVFDLEYFFVLRREEFFSFHNERLVEAFARPKSNHLDGNFFYGFKAGQADQILGQVTDPNRFSLWSTVSTVLSRLRCEDYSTGRPIAKKNVSPPFPIAPAWSASLRSLREQLKIG